MTTDLLGPGDAGTPRTLTTTADVTTPAAGDTFFVNCVNSIAGTGTPFIEKWLNRFLQQVRLFIRRTGIPLSNADDDMLGQALQSNAVFWAGTFGGTANALTATLSPVPTALVTGMIVRGKFAAANTAAATLTLAVGGAKAIKRSDGVALSGGEFASGGVGKFQYGGTNWQLISGLPMSFVSSPTRRLYLIPTGGGFTAGTDVSGNIVIAANETRMRVRMWGGGGGGGGNAVYQTGGGGGGYCEFYVTGLTPSTSIPYTVGAGYLSGGNGDGNPTILGTAGSIARSGGGLGGGNGVGGGGGTAVINNSGPGVAVGFSVPGQAGGNTVSAGYGWGGASFRSAGGPQLTGGAGTYPLAMFPGGGAEGGNLGAGAKGLMIVDLYT